jgi:hypothetical protein
VCDYVAFAAQQWYPEIPVDRGLNWQSVEAILRARGWLTTEIAALVANEEAVAKPAETQPVGGQGKGSESGSGENESEQQPPVL